MKSIVKSFGSLVLVASLSGCGAGLEVFAVGAALTAGTGAVGIASAVQAHNGDIAGTSGSGMAQSVGAPAESSWTLQFTNGKEGTQMMTYVLGTPPEDYFWKKALQDQRQEAMSGSKICHVLVSDGLEQLPETLEVQLVDLNKDTIQVSTVNLIVWQADWEGEPPTWHNLFGILPKEDLPKRAVYQVSLEELRENKPVKISNPFKYASWSTIYFTVEYPADALQAYGMHADERRQLRVDVPRPGYIQ